MAFYENSIVDDVTGQPRTSSKVFVHAWDGREAQLTGVGGGVLRQPLSVDSQGIFSFNAEPGVYSIRVMDGGKVVYVENNVNVGTPQLPASVISALSAPGGAALVGTQSGLSVQQRLSADWINAKDYGAKGDGIHDDTGALQEAINDSIQYDRALYVPAGVYSVSALSATLSEGGWQAGFAIHGDSWRNTIFKKRGTGIEPILSVSHIDAPQVANVELQDFAIDGMGFAEAIHLENIANFTISRVNISQCTDGIHTKGSLIGQIEKCTIADCVRGIFTQRNNPGAWANAITVRNSRVVSCRQAGIDFGDGSLLNLDAVNLEQNGTAGNASTGAILLRGSIDDEIGYGAVLINGCWLEANHGWSIRAEAAENSLLRISGSKILASEGGHSILVEGGRTVSIEATLAPTVNDIFDINADRLSIRDSIFGILTGAQNSRVIENTIIASESDGSGGYQRGITLGGAQPIRLEWGHGAGYYELLPDPLTGNLIIRGNDASAKNILLEGGLSLTVGNRLNVAGTNMLGPQGAAIPAASGGAVVDTEARAMLAQIVQRLTSHGLIAA